MLENCKKNIWRKVGNKTETPCWELGWAIEWGKKRKPKVMKLQQLNSTEIQQSKEYIWNLSVMVCSPPRSPNPQTPFTESFLALCSEMTWFFQPWGVMAGSRIQCHLLFLFFFFFNPSDGGCPCALCSSVSSSMSSSALLMKVRWGIRHWYWSSFCLAF